MPGKGRWQAVIVAGSLLVASSVGRAAPDQAPEPDEGDEPSASASLSASAAPPPVSSAPPRSSAAPALEPTAAAAARARRPVPVIPSGPGDRPYQFDIGPTLTFMQRRLRSSVVGNHLKASTDGTQINSSLAPGIIGRAHLQPWLALSFRYMRTLHTLDLAANALGSESDDPTATDKLRVISLQAALQPTWVVRPTLRLYASIGIGWASVQVPAIQVPPPGAASQTSSTTIRSRRGTMREVPLGVGISWWVLPRWLVVSYEASYSQAFGFSGDAYSPDSYINSAGNHGDVRPMPRFIDSFSHQLALSLTL